MSKKSTKFAAAYGIIVLVSNMHDLKIIRHVHKNKGLLCA